MKSNTYLKNIFHCINEFLDKLILSKWLYILIGVIFIGISALIFSWGSIIVWKDPNYVVDKELFGTFGDFIGGVLGTIFSIISIILIVKTFIHQRQITKDNEKQLETQRFNDMFFELLRLYQSEVSELCGQFETPTNKNKTESTEVVYNNKDFFDFEKERLQLLFVNEKSYDNNRQNSLILYMSFYIENRTKLGAYYRTLYRIYDLIDNSGIEEKSKKNYLKIMRAQLTESELFFLRYNALSYHGHKFIKYINKYNILKHLPAFELLEFKDWWKTLNQTERMGMNIIFDNLNRYLRKIFENKYSGMSIKDKNSKYNFSIKVENNYDVQITFYIDKTKKNTIIEYSALEKFDPKRIQQLLDCFIKEIFIYSNFQKFNTKNIQTYSDNIQHIGNETIINSGIRNTKKEQLMLKVDFN